MIVEELDFGNQISGRIVHKKNTFHFFNSIFMPEEYRCYIVSSANPNGFYLTSMRSQEQAREYLLQLQNSKTK
jgi:hypothetical protein